MERNKPLSQIIPPAFHDAYWEVAGNKYRHYWFRGGRGSGKSTFISVMICLGLMLDKRANAVCFRMVGNTCSDSVYKQIIEALGYLDVEKYWRYKVHPLEIVNRKTGQRIMFRGADDVTKVKGIKASPGYFKYVWFEELTEFRGMDDVRNIIQSVGRGTDEFQAFYSYNPPRSSNNWVNAECLIHHDARLVHSSDYRTMPEEWLGNVFIEEAENLRLTNDKAYRNVYLGEITGTGGQVFDNLTVRRITDDELSTLDKPYYGLDFGFAVDPDALVECFFDVKHRILYITREFYATHNSTETLSKQCISIAGKHIITCDSAEPRMIAELRRLGVGVIPAKKGVGSVDHGIRWMQNLPSIVIDSERTPHAVREFSQYEYTIDRYGNYHSDYPDKDNHSIDAVRYGIESLSTRRVATTIRKGLLGM